MNKLILMRGLPGSGKSFLAEQILTHYGIESCVICSTDHYWINEEGKYIFRGKELGFAHKWNQDRVLGYMSNSFPIIIVDNTNTTAKEAKIYVDTARRFCYNVEVVEPQNEWFNDVDECFKRGTHNVPIDVLRTMKNRYQPIDIFKKELGL